MPSSSAIPLLPPPIMSEDTIEGGARLEYRYPSKWGQIRVSFAVRHVARERTTSRAASREIQSATKALAFATVGSSMMSRQEAK
jgi:hypothetical protein